MTDTRLVGVIPPMITPFNDDGEVDSKALVELVSFLVKHVNGLFICGTYGSGPMMEVDDRKKVVETVTATVGGRINVIVHVGATNTNTAVKLAKHAEAAGATHISSVPPYYYSHNEEEVRLYFETILKEVKIPLYVYNNPKTVGYGVSSNFLVKLADMGLSGVKDSSFDIMVLNDYMRKVKKENFDFVLGTEAMFLPASVLGIKAFIPGLANAFPELVRKLYDAAIKGHYDDARELQNKILYLRDSMHMVGSNVASVHAMLKLRGINAGVPKKPYLALDKDMTAKIADRLKAAGVI
jgi:dihydrodipicolinate synthase/N-acetylneuraminate lyase